MKVTLALLATLFLAAQMSRGELNFESKRATHQATPSETTFETVFAFKNTGNHPVVIEKVDTNCGCIRAETDKARYEKGESGTVTAVFKIGSAEGVQTKSITVLYTEEKPGGTPQIVKPRVIGPADADSAVTSELDRPEPVPPRLTTERLTVELHIPAVIEIEPKITKWQVGDPADTKTVTVTMKHDEPVAIRSVRSSRENVNVVLKTIEAGRRYELQVTPDTTASVQLGMLTIETDCSIKKHQKKLAFFSIHRRAPARQPIKGLLQDDGKNPSGSGPETAGARPSVGTSENGTSP